MRLVAFVGLTLSLAACAYNYGAASLGAVSMGMTKAEFIQRYTRSAMQGPVPRAAKIVGRDTLDVLTMPVDDVNRVTSDYWFLFQNGRLAQWGKPQDWRAVAATYHIDLTLTP